MTCFHADFRSINRAPLMRGCAASALLHVAIVGAIAMGQSHTSAWIPDARADELNLNAKLVDTIDEPAAAEPPHVVLGDVEEVVAPRRAGHRALLGSRRPAAEPQQAVLPLLAVDRAPPNDQLQPPTPTPVKHVAANVAQALRIYDPYPDLPDALRADGNHTVLVEICVSAQGEVRDVTMDHRSAAAFERILETAIRNWRYQPLIEGGAAQPFCHDMEIAYSTR
jgi:TonB family protein